jgi:hypothetical protein
MTRHRVSYIKCDECAHTYERPAASIDLTATEAHRNGWSIKEDRDDGRDLCADCAGREGDT